MIKINSSERRHYFRGIIWASSGNMAVMAASLVTLMFAARVLTKEEIGAYFLTMVIVQFAVSLGDIGLRNAAIKFLSQAENGEIVNVSRYLLTINGLASGLACLILSLMLPFLTKLWPSSIFFEVAWYSIPITFLTINFQMGLSILAGHKHFGSMSAITAVIEIFRMIISLGALYFGFGAVGLLLSMLLSRVAGIALVWRKVPSCMRPVLRHQQVREILKFSGWMYGASLMSVINMRTADAMVTSHMGTVALASYSTAMQIPTMLQKIFESIRPVVLGYVSSLKLETAHASIATSRLLSGLLAIGATFLIALAHPLVVLFFSSRYEDSVPIMQVLSAWIAIGTVNYYIAITLIGMGKSREVFILSIPQFFVMLISCVLLVPAYHGLGAAVSLIITALAGNIIGSWMLAGGNWGLFGTLNWTYLKSIVPLLLFLIIVLWVKPLLAITLILSIIMIVILFLLKAVTFADLRSLRSQVAIKK